MTNSDKENDIFKHARAALRRIGQADAEGTGCYLTKAMVRDLCQSSIFGSADYHPAEDDPSTPRNTD